MNEYTILEELLNKVYFTRSDLREVINSIDSEYSVNSISFLLKRWIKEKHIIKVKRDYYQVLAREFKREYESLLSNQAKDIKKDLIKMFPELDFQIWDLSLLNEFINHQIALNTVVVEVENKYINYVFDSLKDNTYSVLLKPSIDLVNMYATKDTLILKQLISETPTNKKDRHKVTLEKILVDVVVDKLTSHLVSEGELMGFYENVLEKYLIDHKKLLRYASRRNAASKIKTYIP